MGNALVSHVGGDKIKFSKKVGKIKEAGFSRKNVRVVLNKDGTVTLVFKPRSGPSTAASERHCPLHAHNVSGIKHDVRDMQQNPSVVGEWLADNWDEFSRNLSHASPGMQIVERCLEQSAIKAVESEQRGPPLSPPSSSSRRTLYANDDFVPKVGGNWGQHRSSK